jgi:hypothetical protein
MGASGLLTLPRTGGQQQAATPNSVDLGPRRDREAQLTRRTRELEEEVRILKEENAKQVRHLSFILPLQPTNFFGT